MQTDKQAKQIFGFIAFIIATSVFVYSAQPVGSLWDCGEFLLAAYKLQVVHPPGAPLFLLIGRLFASAGDTLSSDPSNIAYAVNMLSALCGGLTALFVAFITFILGKILMVGRLTEMTDQNDRLAVGMASLVGGLTAAFCASIWFSAVEAEVYAMSTMFTVLTLWAMVEWYNMPNDADHDRWVVLSLFAASLSIGVHLLSLLTMPALTVLYYLKKRNNPTLKGTLLSIGAGAVMIILIQKLIIAGIPTLWKNFEIFSVNSLGLFVHSGLIFVALIIGGLLYVGIRYAHKNNSGLVQMLTVGVGLVILGFSVLAMVPIRSNAHPPVNMSAPTDATRLLPYLNREQYGERPLLFGPQFNASPVSYDSEDRYGLVGDHYEITDEKLTPVYRKSDEVFFPRMSHNDPTRVRLYTSYYGAKPNKKPSFVENMSFFFRYQVFWMYGRYFMWNFAGKQNGKQGFYDKDKGTGNWLSGIKFFDEARLYNMDYLPDAMKMNKAYNKYFCIPLILGLIGIFFHYKEDKRTFLTLLGLFVITGLGLVIYTNEPPNEPRERDYVFVGSFFTYAIWIGLALLAMYKMFKERFKQNSPLAPLGVAAVLALSAPILMANQNMDDIGRRDNYASRDYAKNFLVGLEPNAIIFTYGDNDTYPLWEVQEVENFRTDVRVINLSLIGIDWYINHHRRKLNTSPGVNYTIAEDAYRGYKRNQVLIRPPANNADGAMSIYNALNFVGERHPLPRQGFRPLESYLPSKNLFIPVDRQKAVQSGWVDAAEANNMVDRIEFDLSKKQYLTKGDLAILDVVASNLYSRPVYFSTTVRDDYLMGLKPYTQLEGIALRVVPFKNAGNRSFGLFGSGRNDLDKNYDLYMNKFLWGNMDKTSLFVDEAYMPTHQAMRMTMMRTANDLLTSGQKSKAVDIAKKYLESFPNMNFRYDYMTVPFINILAESENLDAYKKHLDIFIEEASQHMRFYQNQNPSLFIQGMSFADNRRYWQQSIRQIQATLQSIPDATYKKEAGDKLNELAPQPSKN